MSLNKNDYTYKVSAAGRVNIIGEHIDYCGGKVFPAALDVCNTVYIRPNNTNKINISWTTLNETVTLDIDDLIKAKSLKYGNYQAGAAYFWKEKGHKVMGCDMLHDCTVPFGSGLSSSAAIEVSTIAALAVIAGEEINPVEIALTAQKAEREFANVNCGIMDQYASACGKKNHAILLDCSTIESTYVPFDLQDYSLVITNCKKPHNLVESKYNERRMETQEALDILQKHVNINNLAELKMEDLIKYKDLLRPVVYNRTMHVVSETQRVNQAIKAMENKDIIKLGEILTASHLSLKDLYEVTGKELDTLFSLATKHPKCIGSRMTGAGFGGCTISLVLSDYVDDFKNYLKENYTKIIGYSCESYDCTIADGIIIEKINKE